MALRVAGDDWELGSWGTRMTRTCARCGKQVSRPPSRFFGPPERSYCGLACRNAGLVLRGEASPAWKGDKASPPAGRKRARQAYRLGCCARCGRSAVDRHHRDGDTNNNSPDNIESLCRRCHMATDGRLAAFVAARLARPLKPPRPCVNCGKPCKPLRRGRCSACDGYWRRHNQERPTPGGQNGVES